MTTETPTVAKPPKRVKLTSLKADRGKERNGDWIVASDLDPDGSISWLVRSTNYGPFKIARDQANEKIARTFKGKPVPDDDSARINGDLAVEHLLLGWKGLADDDGEDIEFSEDKAREILTDEAYRAVRYSIYIAATQVGRGEVEHIEDGAKN